MFRISPIPSRIFFSFPSEFNFELTPQKFPVTQSSIYDSIRFESSLIRSYMCEKKILFLNCSFTANKCLGYHRYRLIFFFSFPSEFNFELTPQKFPVTQSSIYNSIRFESCLIRSYISEKKLFFNYKFNQIFRK